MEEDGQTSGRIVNQLTVANKWRKKDRQGNDQMKRDKQRSTKRYNTTQKTKDRATRTQKYKFKYCLCVTIEGN
jgi:hypothetical protein